MLVFSCIYICIYVFCLFTRSVGWGWGVEFYNKYDKLWLTLTIHPWHRKIWKINKTTQKVRAKRVRTQKEEATRTTEKQAQQLGPSLLNEAGLFLKKAKKKKKKKKWNEKDFKQSNLQIKIKNTFVSNKNFLSLWQFITIFTSLVNFPIVLMGEVMRRKSELNRDTNAFTR